MPRYEYRCQECGNVFEVQQKFADSPLEVHEQCGGRVERLISAPAIQFKGSGWYITDYARGSKSPAQSDSSDGKSETKPETKTETKTETKSESKSESKSTETASKPAADK